MKILIGIILISSAWSQTEHRATKKKPGSDAPECTKGAVCFSGEVLYGQEFRRPITRSMDFVINGGTRFAVVPSQTEGECDDFSNAVNPPHRAHKLLDLSADYDWTVEQEVAASPRRFKFVTNCADSHVEVERLRIVLWPYMVTEEKAAEAMEKLGTSASGTGRIWITGSNVSHADDPPDNNHGKILWMKFSVEILLPTRK